jgi:hypothetical protein
MRVRWRLATMILVLAGAGAGAAPSCVFACSCAAPPSLREAVEEWGSAVFVGRAVARTGETVSFAVERWYVGSGAAPVVQLQAGDGAMCGVDVRPGAYLVLTATRDELGRFTPSICSPYGHMGSPEATRLLAEAERTFGPGQRFGGGPAPGETPVAGPAWGPFLAIGAAGVTIGGLAIAAIVLLLRRRET